MSYIAYLDLLGTRGFCEDSEVYYKNISNFSHSVETLAPILGKAGRICIFSDCVYIECSQLEKILQFLTQLRLMLIGDNLFLTRLFLMENLVWNQLVLMSMLLKANCPKIIKRKIQIYLVSNSPTRK